MHLQLPYTEKALTDQAIEKINLLINKYPNNPWFYELKGQIL